MCLVAPPSPGSMCDQVGILQTKALAHPGAESARG
jgi:hypothetical protein